MTALLALLVAIAHASTLAVSCARNETNVSSASQDDARRPPNIVYLMADDLGWKDVGYHGSEIQTPHIDRLAAAGTRLEAMYALPVCTPSRAAFMTGRHPVRYGMNREVIKIGDRYGLPLDERTIAEALRDAGYETALVGKWHLGAHDDVYKPTRRGFDHQYGFYTGELDYYTHLRPDGELDWFRDEKPADEKGYTTTLIAKEAVRRIEERDEKKPLFLFVAFNAPHRPLQAPKSYMDRYKSIDNKFRRMKAATTTCLDDAVGEIVAAIEKQGLAKDTLVIFSSDNGGNVGKTFESDNRPLRGGKGNVYEGGVRLSAVCVWPEVLAPGRVVNERVHFCDWYPTFAALAGAKLDPKRAIDGKDIWPVLAHAAKSPHAEILVNAVADDDGIEQGGRALGSAILVGDWKLVVAKSRQLGASEAVETVELFDLSKDPNETTNVAPSEPERVKAMRARLAEYASEAAPPLSER